MLFAIAGESLSFLNVPYQPKIVTMLLFTYLFILFLFRAKIFMAVSMTIASIGSMILAEFVILMLLNSQQIYGFDILTTSFLQHFAGFLYLFVLALLAFFLRMLKIDLRRMVPQNRHNRYLFMLILIGSIEFLLILFISTFAA